jgi:acetyl/propionyl-CoA carboxylase alpha subunit
MAKVIAHGADREQALARAVRAVDAFTIVAEIQPALPCQTAEQPGIRFRRPRHRNHRPDAGVTAADPGVLFAAALAPG